MFYAGNSGTRRGKKCWHGSMLQPISISRSRAQTRRKDSKGQVWHLRGRRAAQQARARHRARRGSLLRAVLRVALVAETLHLPRDPGPVQRARPVWLGLHGEAILPHGQVCRIRVQLPVLHHPDRRSAQGWHRAAVIPRNVFIHHHYYRSQPNNLFTLLRPPLIKSSPKVNKSHFVGKDDRYKLIKSLM